jgi:hypothetical protein
MELTLWFYQIYWNPYEFLSLSSDWYVRLSGRCGWQVSLTLFLIFKAFQSPKHWNLNWCPSWCTKILQILQVNSLKYKEKLYFLDQLQNPTGLQVINVETNSNLNLTWILKGFKPFWKNLINSLKFHLHMLYLNMNFIDPLVFKYWKFLYKWKKVLVYFVPHKSWPLKYIAPTITSTPLYQTGQGVF